MNQKRVLISEVNHVKETKKEQVNISFARLDTNGLKVITNGNLRCYVPAKSYNGPQAWRDRTSPWNRR